MSQIYEAMKRASEDVGDDDRLGPAAADVPSRPPGAPALEPYAREAHGSVSQFPREAVREAEHPAPPAVSAVPAVLRAPAVPRPPIAAPRRAANPALEGKLVLSREISPSALEHYRGLAAALQEVQDRSTWGGDAAIERSLRTVLVTSALPGEGKTLTAVNLALTLCGTHKRRVLVIDASLHRPSIHAVLTLPNAVGLSDVLRSGTESLQLQEVTKRLSVLTAGNGAAMSMKALTSERMRALLDECAPRFDWVFVDAPAVGLLPDPHLLARLTRAVMLVIASGSTPYTVVERAIGELGRGCIIGTVLNRIDAG